MKRTWFNTVSWMVLSGLILTSCATSTNPSNTETATSGNIRIAVDESYLLLGQAELDVFTSQYKYAKISPVFASEDSILQLFLKDSVRLMITSRKLTKNEEAYLQSKYIYPKTVKVAYDAVAFIENKSNRDSMIRYNTIRDVFLGKINSWKQINPKSRLQDIKIVFDNNHSANVRYVVEKFGLTSGLPKYCYSAQTNEGVLSYVEKHPEAIGVISVNWISDPADSVSHNFLTRVRPIGFTSEYFSEGEDFYQPYQAYIADKSYPFVRDIYAINRETFTGLGTGFIQFFAGEQGQRIVLKSGMVPATMPVRIIQMKKE